jgi:hypothetical protein
VDPMRPAIEKVRYIRRSQYIWGSQSGTHHLFFVIDILVIDVDVHLDLSLPFTGTTP